MGKREGEKEKVEKGREGEIKGRGGERERKMKGGMEGERGR